MTRTGEAGVSNGMTRDELLALPAAVNLAVASRALGMHHNTGYALAKAGQFPVTVHRIRRTYRVPTAEILRYLGITDAA